MGAETVLRYPIGSLDGHVKKKQKSFWDVAAEVFPESLDLIERTKKEMEAGLAREAPRTWKAGRNWGDAWLYLFMRIDLDASQPLGWVLRTFLASYFSPNWHRKVLRRCTGLASYFVAE